MQIMRKSDEVRGFDCRLIGPVWRGACAEDTTTDKMTQPARGLSRTAPENVRWLLPTRTDRRLRSTHTGATSTGYWGVEHRSGPACELAPSDLVRADRS